MLTGAVNYFNNQGYNMTDSYKLDLIYSGLYLSLFKNLKNNNFIIPDIKWPSVFL